MYNNNIGKKYKNSMQDSESLPYFLRKTLLKILKFSIIDDFFDQKLKFILKPKNLHFTQYLEKIWYQ